MKKKQVDENGIRLDFKNVNLEEYKIEIILYSVVYIRELEIAHLPKLYYFIF